MTGRSATGVSTGNGLTSLGATTSGRNGGSVVLVELAGVSTPAGGRISAASGLDGVVTFCATLVT